MGVPMCSSDASISAEPDVARREFNAVEVLRDHALRRQDLHAGAVRVLLDLSS